MHPDLKWEPEVYNSRNSSGPALRVQNIAFLWNHSLRELIKILLGHVLCILKCPAIDLDIACRYEWETLIDVPW